MADRRAIYVLLLNAYLERLSGKGGEGEPDGPFWGKDIEVHLYEDILVLACKHFRLDFPASAAGMLEARRAIDELSTLAEGNLLGLGDELILTEDGYRVAPDESLALIEAVHG